MKQKIVVTAALPYANGDIHIGHLLEYIQTDIFVRYLKLIGEDALYICASDMHGTPIEINAKKAGKKPEEFALKYWREHQKDFKLFQIHFDNYWKTHSEENKELAELFFKTLKKKKLIYTKEIEQMYDEKAKRFLPDRYVKGKCPKCGAEDQYGDVCEKCNATYCPPDLIEPYSVLTNTKPVLRKSTHYFFKLSSFTSKLKKWIKGKNSGLQEEMKNFVLNWIDKGLKDWCISRDEPYFGFVIPDSKKEIGAVKYFYVWLDAPIGYISSTKNLTKKWKDYWYKGKIYHFIGKDIAYFHYLFWPAMLMAMDIPLPILNAHGFITVNGEKMSKSRGTFFTAKDFNKLFPVEALRFFYASHLDRKICDVELNLDEFTAVNNNVLMGNLGNFCYRTLTFACKNYETIKVVKEENELIKKINKLIGKVAKSYEEMNFKEAVKNILKISDLGNQYFQSSEPWKDKERKVAQVGFCLNLARNLSILIAPILPEFAQKVQQSLGEKNLNWSDIGYNWRGDIKKPELLVEKIEEVKEEEFFPIQLKVGKIIGVKDHPDADSLYLGIVDFGTEKRQVIFGLRNDFSKKEILGKKTVFVVNLEPAKLRGEKSEAMTLMAEFDKKPYFLDTTAKIGEEVTFERLENSDKIINFKEFLKVKMVVKDKKIYFKDKVLGKVSTKDVPPGAKLC